MAFEIGMTGRAEGVVTEETTAAAVGSGSLPVFATPMMTALMEAAAVDAVSGALEPGTSSVGTRMEISHDSASPIGIRVWAEAVLTRAEGKHLFFDVAAFDAAGPIGKGTHERFVITADRFLAKAQGKLEC